MSKHNNNTMPSSHAKCRCGRYATIGECKSHIGFNGYTCPDCKHRQYSQSLTSTEFYEQFNRI
jgi:hypothetical protein